MMAARMSLPTSRNASPPRYDWIQVEITNWIHPVQSSCDHAMVRRVFSPLSQWPTRIGCGSAPVMTQKSKPYPDLLGNCEKCIKNDKVRTAHDLKFQERVFSEVSKALQAAATHTLLGDTKTGNTIMKMCQAYTKIEKHARYIVHNARGVFFLRSRKRCRQASLGTPSS
jgi:hypothetical protein